MDILEKIRTNINNTQERLDTLYLEYSQAKTSDEMLDILNEIHTQSSILNVLNSLL